MLFKGITKKYQHLKRYREIVEILIKHGFGYLINELDLYQFVPLSKRIKTLDSSAPPETSKAKRLRKVLEELGPTFIKLGQLLSTRPDILPQEYILELEKLQDQAPPITYEEVIEQLESELETDYEELFQEFSPAPLASASIGQVHKAILHDGTEVVVKVQRPGIEQKVNSDLDIMTDLAGMLEKRVFDDLFISPVKIMDNFSELIKKELDYRNEARNSVKFKNNFAEEEKVKVADLYWEFITKKILVMEYIDGVSINELSEDIDRHQMAETIFDSFMKQILLDGCFHGDPHPGNIMITHDSKLGLIDFGLIGQISQRDREIAATLFMALLQKEMDLAVDELLNLGIVTEEIDKSALKRDLYKLVDDYYGATLEQVELGPLINRLFNLSFKYKIKLPFNFILLGKSLVTIEGLISKIDPKFDTVAAAKPFMSKLIKAKLNPKRLLKDLFSGGRNIFSTLSEMPDEVQYILKLLKNQDLAINLEHSGLNQFIAKLDIITNRISMAVIVAALIIGSSLIMLSDKGPLFLDYPIIGLTGYLLAVVFGSWLVISILKSGRF
ncbi:ABC1 kinase family protein [Halanaerobacter jeridensis]|uniref:Ubiquinone biosynthesis protein n=1 Tax=Halanaerobacter jeridensis TaxID=706427 RepID=A0A939BMF0_9FIRM|nr:AarF/ABC1/UbiB kinase family protein [Halanaerobacter jeridensis]MBM7556280.1 ubiquinone biosynthesis protein [Halanaerobacter jeridensis]